MPDLALELALQSRGFLTVAGIDEAGRGPLAGPVSAAAVVLPPNFSCPGLDDSKKLSAATRDRLFDYITTHPDVRWSVAIADLIEIDTLNILGATHLAMKRAAQGLTTQPDYCLIDGLPVKNFPFNHDGIVKGDGLSLSIAAASIIAKVTRDRIMKEICAEFPQYGFSRHQGYGTKDHLDAIRTHGPCRHHRRSFKPIAQLQFSFEGR